MNSTRSMCATAAPLLLALALGNSLAATPGILTYAFDATGKYPVLQVNQTGSQLAGFILFRTHESQTSVGQQFFTGTRTGQGYSLKFKPSETGVITGCQGVLTGADLSLRCSNEYGGNDIRLALKKTAPRAGYNVVANLKAAGDCDDNHQTYLRKAMGMIDSLGKVAGLTADGYLTFDAYGAAAQNLFSATAVASRLREEGDDYRTSRSFALDVEWLRQVRDQEARHSSQSDIDAAFARATATDARISAQFQKINPQFVTLIKNSRQAEMKCPPEPRGLIPLPQLNYLQMTFDEYRREFYADVQEQYAAMTATLRKAKADMDAILTPTNLRFAAEQRALTPKDPRDTPGYVAPTGVDPDAHAPNAYDAMITAQENTPGLAAFAPGDFYQDDVTPGKVAMTRETEKLAYELSLENYFESINRTLKTYGR